MNNEQTNTAIALQDEFQKEILSYSTPYLEVRGVNNPEFKIKFENILSDMVFSQTEDGLEKLKKARPQSLLNAVYRASEVNASFAKKQISVLPFSANKTVTEKGVTRTVVTGQFDLTIVIDINYQKQMILAMPNCKKFFTGEVHEGVQVIKDLTTGLYIFEGTNYVTKPTVGYYACFITKDDQVYPLFMTCKEIIERAKCNPSYKDKNYEITNNNIHFEKIVVRNLMKEIPQISNELKSVLAFDEVPIFSEYEDVTDGGKSLESAKKEISTQSSTFKVSENIVGTQKMSDKAEVVTSTEETQESGKENEVKSFF